MTGMIDDDYLDARREYHTRMRRAKKMREAFNLIANIAILGGAVVVFFVVMAWLRDTRDMREKAAWCEGYYGVDRATAVAMAEAGAGKTAGDVVGW